VSRPLPSLRAVARELRALNEAWGHEIAGPEYAALTLHDDGAWSVEMLDSLFFPNQFGRELVPASRKFDAVGAAQRLLAAARDEFA
jgi:hypothetical protein